MPILSCSAVTCVYNKEELCSKGDIMVSGPHAKTADETCCSSFKERSENDMSNSTGSGSEKIDVGCTACECVYNSDEKCSASKIHVGGANACDCRETKCGTFECNCH